MTRETQRQLYRALEARHRFELEIERDAAPGCDLDEQIEATGRVLQWLDHQAFAIEPQASPAVQTAPSSPEATKASRRWINHCGDTPTGLTA
jgi:hypothetical protein